jgi:tRNA nucleotidyltransferase (CCA-adding enzyme)
MRPELCGEDLKELGFEPGPRFKEILERLLAARLDGEVSDREEEMALVKREFGAGEEARA